MARRSPMVKAVKCAKKGDHVQSFCFAYVLFAVPVAVAAVVALFPIFIWQKNKFLAGGG